MGGDDMMGIVMGEDNVMGRMMGEDNVMGGVMGNVMGSSETYLKHTGSGSIPGY